MSLVDITEKLVIDAGLIGMKTKFCNFVMKGSKQENTVSREVNVRGSIHIALFATQRIDPGEEFLFDYQFGQVIPEWAKKPDGNFYHPGLSNPDSANSTDIMSCDESVPWVEEENGELCCGKLLEFDGYTEEVREALAHEETWVALQAWLKSSDPNWFVGP